MSNQDANTTELDPSATSAVKDAEAPTSANYVLDDDALDRADSSSAQRSDNDGDLLSVVRDVVQDRGTEGDASAVSQAAGDEEGGEAAPGTQQQELDDENFTDVPFHKHPRFKQVIGRMKAAETDASHMRRLDSFLSDHGVSGEDAWGLLQIRALANTDPGKAWELAKPLVQDLLRASGEWLDEDLQAAVTAGEISQARAVELSKARAHAAASDNRSALEASRAQARDAAQVRTQVSETVAAWAAEREVKDPNFKAKQVALQKEVLFLQRTDGIPNTPQGVRAQLDKAYANMAGQSTTAATNQPRQKPAITPITGGQQSGNAARGASSNGMSTLDIIRSNRAGR